jgi:hypothetical protein
MSPGSVTVRFAIVQQPPERRHPASEQPSYLRHHDEWLLASTITCLITCGCSSHGEECAFTFMAGGEAQIIQIIALLFRGPAHATAQDEARAPLAVDREA